MDEQQIELMALEYALGQIFCEMIDAEEWLGLDPEETEEVIKNLPIWQPFENFSPERIMVEVENETCIAEMLIKNVIEKCEGNKDD